MDSDSDTSTGLQLKLDAHGKDLHASFTPGRSHPAPSRQDVVDTLAVHGWKDGHLDESAIAAFVAACHRAAGARDTAIRHQKENAEAAAAASAAAGRDEEHDGTIVAPSTALLDAAVETTAKAVTDAVIGQLLDGEVEFDVAADALSVHMTLIPPQGGRAVDLLKVKTELAVRGIKAPVDEAALATLLSAGRGDKVLIVSGVPVTEGKAAQFENLLEPNRPAIDDENARVDLRDLGNLQLVSAGTPLMRRTPARQGIAGQDVFGRVVTARAVNDQFFADRLIGAAADPNDANLLVATVAGMPSVKVRGISVNPVVDVAAVDMHSGNVTFDGTLRVNGDIKTGMTVRVAGDVIVSGTIEAALVEAGGNVIVSGGIIGKAEAGGAHDPAHVVARVQCKGSVHARFIENAVVEAGTTVTADTGIRQSDVSAGDAVVAGDPATGQGNITGGRVRATMAVRTSTLGAAAGIATIIHAGLNPYADAEKTELEGRRQRMQEEQAKVQKLVTFLAEHPEKAVGDVREKARSTLFKYTTDLLDLDAELAELMRQLQPQPLAEVVVGKKMHNGVTISIGNKQLRVMEDQVGGHFRVVDERISHI